MNDEFLKSRQNISIELNEMRQEPKLTDLSFVCRKSDSSFHVIDAHQAIFSTLSSELKMLFDIAKQKQPYEKVVIIIESVNNIIMEKLIQYIYTGEITATYTEKESLLQLSSLLKLNISLTLDSIPTTEFDTSLLEICNQMRGISPDVTLEKEIIYKENLKTATGTNEIQAEKQSINVQSCLTNKRKRKSVKRFQIHNKNNINLSTTIPKTSRTFPRKSSVNCKFCEVIIFSSYSSHELEKKLRRHILLIHDKIRRFHCEKCSHSASTFSNLKNHYKGVHDNIKEFNCEKCLYSCLRKDRLKRHNDAVHEKKKPYICNKCEFKTARKDKLKRHDLKCKKVVKKCT